MIPLNNNLHGMPWQHLNLMIYLKRRTAGKDDKREVTVKLIVGPLIAAVHTYCTKYIKLMTLKPVKNCR